MTIGGDTGEFWQEVPSTIQVEFTGETEPFVTGEDLILSVIAEMGVGGGTNQALEFLGAGALSTDERLAVANMAIEAGSETGFFPADETTGEYLVGAELARWISDDAPKRRELQDYNLARFEQDALIQGEYEYSTRTPHSRCVLRRVGQST